MFDPQPNIGKMKNAKRKSLYLELYQRFIHKLWIFATSKTEYIRNG